jgi:predicted DNA-binding transcriptional regulator AlpA
MPDAPRWLDREAAAAHVGLSVLAFSRRVASGDLPAPSDALGPRCLRWDRHALDTAMGCGVASPVGAANLAQAILEEARR